MTLIDIIAVIGVISFCFRVVDCQCIDGDIRYDPEHNGLMIIQVCADNKWGYVCAGNNNLFTNEDAAVTCNQLGGYKTDDNYLAAFLNESLDGDLSYNRLYCTGLENKLADCANHDTYNSRTIACGNCGEMSEYCYAAVNCSHEEPILCNNGDVQRNDNKDLQVCILGKWNYICASEGWNDNDAQTVCRNLGENPEGAKGLSRLIDDNDDQVYKIRFHCTGEEQRLVDCQRSLASKFFCDLNDNMIAVAKCGDLPLLSIKLFPLSNSQLTVQWSTATAHDNQTKYLVSCTSINTSSSTQTFTYQSQSVSNSTSVILSDLADNITYKCCVAAQDTANNPVCETVEIPPETTVCTDGSNGTLWSLLMFVIGLIIGSIFMSAVTIGCVIYSRHKHQKLTNNHSNNAISGEQPAVDNLLYGLENSVLKIPEASNALYDSIDRRPPAEIPPSLPIAPYETVMPTDGEYERRYSTTNGNL